MHQRPPKRRAGLIAGLMVANLTLGWPVPAAVLFGVTSTTDAGDANPGDGVCETASGNGVCTLRAAIQESNAFPGADGVRLPVGTFLLTIPGSNEEAAATGDLDITDDLTIDGAGPDKTIIDGNGLDRVFDSRAEGISLIMQDLTIQNGYAVEPSPWGGGLRLDAAEQAGFLDNVIVRDNKAQAGGGIFHRTATVTLANSIVSHNTATPGNGGGIRSLGVLQISKTSIHNNKAARDGGGIDTSTSLTLLDSSVTANVAGLSGDFDGRGAGINVHFGSATLTNCTISGNAGSRIRGGIESGGVRGNGSDTTVENCTVSQNFPNGIFNARLANTIVAANRGPDCQAPIISLGHNLDSDGTCNLTEPSDLPNVNPRFGPPSGNGGPTFTQALLDGSPAIDAGDPGGCGRAHDQRGVLRPIDGDGDGAAVCDIGAYEAAENPATAEIALGLGPFPSSGGWVEVIQPTAPNDHLHWQRVAWADYNAGVGETRPATCDIDGDGRDEEVLGLGSFPSNGGWLEVKDDASMGYSHLAWLRVPWPAYNSSNGETFPGCGDLDGDGRAEIAVGLGEGGRGWVRVFDDAISGYVPLLGTPVAGGWLQLGWAAYNSAVGEVHPASGNVDGDARAELVLGLGQTGNGWVQILDDVNMNFVPLSGTPVANGWLRLQWSTYNTATGETRPAVCDLDGNGSGEIVLGLATGGGGWVQVFDSTTGFQPLASAPTPGGWARVSWSVYNATQGQTSPACGELDGDGRDELVLGLESFPANGGWVEVKEDLSNNLAHRSWARVHWSAYNSANGETRPAVGR